MPTTPTTLANRLVLFRYFNSLFGFETFEQAQAALRDLPSDYDAQGRSYYFGAMKGVWAFGESRLAEYDENIKRDVARLNARRPDPIQLKYFQYLAALYTEHYLAQRASNPTALMQEVNRFAHAIGTAATFTLSDFNKVAYWMATGSGKTLLLHLNYYQFLRYSGNDPGDNVMLITPPGELLTAQHREELRLSSIAHLSFDEALPIGTAHPVRVVEISKLTRDKKGGGVSLDVEGFEGRNLLFVDEGHKGSKGGGEAAWRDLRTQLGESGFTFEYSATFGQVINPARDVELAEEYGKAILFDYSYKYFYEDGYGKDYEIVNLSEDRAEELTEDFLLANLLAFYEQVRLYADQAQAFRAYNLQPPLWIFIGASVNAVYSEDKTKKSDVLRVALFFNQVLENKRGWVTKRLGDLISGKTKLRDPNHRDLFAGRFEYVRQLRLSPAELYADILRRVFHAETPGALRLLEIKNGDGEIGLKAGNADTFFGLINIGDVSAFLKLAEAEPTLTREADAFTDGLFDTLKNPQSPVNILIGSRKFIEGWSSWRVSTIGLLNIGRSEGPQIIQLFGRGVRLLGRDRTLKRSRYLPRLRPHPARIELLETLNVFGVRASYMERFREYLQREGVPTTGHELVSVPIDIQPDFLKENLLLPTALPMTDFAETESLTLPAKLEPVPVVDLRPTLKAITSQSVGGLTKETQPGVTLNAEVLRLLDWDQLWLEAQQYKQEHGWHNLSIPRVALREFFEQKNYTLYALDEDVQPQTYGQVARAQAAAQALVKRQMEQFYNREHQAWARKHSHYQPLKGSHANLAFGAYQLKLPATEQKLIKQVQALVANTQRLWTEEDRDLPRIIFDRHLYQPLLKAMNGAVSSPPLLNKSEERFVEKLRSLLRAKIKQGALTGQSVFLLRNQAKHGVGFYDANGFYPDFILWIKVGQRQKIVFIEPHGGIYESPTSPKVQLHKTIKAVEKTLGDPNVTLEYFMLSATELVVMQNSANWKGYDRAQLKALHILLPDESPEELLSWA